MYYEDKTYVIMGSPDTDFTPSGPDAMLVRYICAEQTTTVGLGQCKFFENTLKGYIRAIDI